MNTPGKKTKIAAAVAVGLALTVSAGQAAAGDRYGRKDNTGERALIGAGIGAVAGALLSDGDGGATVAGAAAGALVGAATADNDRRHYRRGYSYREPRYNSGYRYRGYDRDYRYDRRYYGGGRYDSRYDRRYYGYGY